LIGQPFGAGVDPLCAAVLPTLELENMFVRSVSAFLVAAVVCLSASSAHAHFLWLYSTKTDAGQPVVYAHFGEEGDDPEAEFVDRLEGLKVSHRGTSGEAKSVTLKKGAEAWEVPLPADLDTKHPGVIITTKNWGVTDRGDTKFLLNYYAKVYPGDITDAQKLGASEPLKLDIVPVVDGKKVTLNVTFEGKPVADAEVVVKGGGQKGDKLKTDAKGQVTVELSEPGFVSLRARHIEAKPGKFEDKDYSEVRHYVTLTMPWGDTAAK
jgi:hypothetical protein